MYDIFSSRFRLAKPCPSPFGRVSLRPWRESDRAFLRRLNADPEVMRYFPAPLSAAQSDALLSRLREHQRREGFGVWLVEVNEEGKKRCAGLAGFMRLVPELPFAVHSLHPPVEAGWRFLPEFWGRGLAFEAATACFNYAFQTMGLEELLAFATAPNLPSRRLMERLGMTHDAAGDFRHPSLPEDHPLSHYCLYRLSPSTWRAARPA